MHPVLLLLRRVLFPAQCLSCDEDLAAARVVPLCARCVLSVQEPRKETLPRALDAFSAAAVYDGAARDLVRGLKYARKTYLAPYMGRLLVGSADELRLRVDVIVPVPLPPLRWVARGFNPSERLAAFVSREWGMPVVANALRRRSGFASQTTLGRARRLENARKSFAAGGGSKAVRGRRVLLIDDVCTSGGTLAACAALLRNAGCASVSAAVFAREPLEIIRERRSLSGAS